MAYLFHPDGREPSVFDFEKGNNLTYWINRESMGLLPWLNGETAELMMHQGVPVILLFDSHRSDRNSEEIAKKYYDNFTIAKADPSFKKELGLD